MRELTVFESVSVDGYFVDGADAMSWAHTPDNGLDAFTSDNAKSGGSLVALLAPEALIDEYLLVLVPVALGGGRTLFQGLPDTLRFTLAESRRFKNGNVFLRYVQYIRQGEPS